MIETKAHELAKKQREISVSEFFTKNRHLLGFDKPTRALLMAVKEACDNSLTYDMPLVIRSEGRISIVKIGEFVNQQMKENKNNLILMRNGDLNKLYLKDNLEVLAFDKKTLKMSFHKVSTLLRHKTNSKIYRVKLTSGRYVDLTAYHSVFTLDEGDVISVPTSQLKIGMPLVVPKNKWESPYILRELNLIEELLLIDQSLTSKINIYGVNSLFTNNIIQEIKNMLPVDKRYRINDFKRFNYLPLNVLRKLHLDISQLSSSRVGMSFSKYKIPVVIKLDSNFAELLGLYISEGSMLKSLTRIHFSFGIHEKELIYYLFDLFEKVFKFLPKIKKAHNTAYNVIANSTILCFVFKHLLRVGDYAKNKKIPDIVFNLNNELKHSFLLGYLAGDGYPSKELFNLLKNKLELRDLMQEKITCATASFELYTGLQYLLSSLGIGYSVGFNKSKKRLINNNLADFGNSYYIYIYSSNKNGAINFLPVENTIINATDPKIKYSISRNNQTNLHVNTMQRTISASKLEVYDGIKTFLSSDLGILRITSIEEIDYNYDWVYDVSVPECENFVAGVGAIVCHNSLDACDETNVLPEILIEIKKISEERFKVIVEDNGPGIVKQQIPNIFGKLLYGSKFHTIAQNRGQQGIGISAVVLYSQLTTGKPIKITSKIGKDKPANYYELNIDTQKNEPKIIKEETIEWNKEHGTKIEIELDGKYQKGRQSVDEYVKETAIANPHATFTYINPLNEKVKYSRAVEQFPKKPKEIKPHPYGMELGNLLWMLSVTSARSIQGFFVNDFSSVGPGTAKEICQKAKVNFNKKPKEISNQEAEALLKAIKETKIRAPPTDCLSPISAEVLEKSLRKEFNADFYTAISRSPNVYRGFPFVIEIGLVYGGEIPKDEQARLIRFANRVPLLFQQGACAINEAVSDISWKPYGMQQSGSNLPYGPLVVLVHLCSVWPPFTSEAKDALAHYEEIIKEIKLALQEAGRELGLWIRKNVRAKEQQDKVNLFEKYIPELASSLSDLTSEKKTKIEEDLKKILKKGINQLLENGETKK